MILSGPRNMSASIQHPKIISAADEKGEGREREGCVIRQRKRDLSYAVHVAFNLAVHRSRKREKSSGGERKKDISLLVKRFSSNSR